MNYNNNFTFPKNEYTIQDIGNEIIVNRKIPNIREQEIFTKDLHGSKILNIVKNNVSLNIKKNFNSLLLLQCSTIPFQTLLQNKKKLNIFQGQKYDKGFKYYHNLGISLQGLNIPRALHEIINIARINNDRFELKIQLKNGETYCLLM